MIFHSIKKETIYIAINELNQEGYPILTLCNFAEIARSSYYKWLNKVDSNREKENKVLIDEIIKLYDEVNGIYGYRRIKLNLERKLNKTINLKRVYRLMKELNLQSVIRKKKKKYVKSNPQITAENVLNNYFQIYFLIQYH